MRKHMVVIVLLLAVAYCRGTTNETNVVALVSLAISPGAENTDERVRAMNDLVRWRSSTIVLLIAEVEKEPTKGEAWWLEGTGKASSDRKGWDAS